MSTKSAYISISDDASFVTVLVEDSESGLKCESFSREDGMLKTSDMLYLKVRHATRGVGTFFLWDARSFFSLCGYAPPPGVVDVSFVTKHSSLIRAAGDLLSDGEVAELNRTRAKFGAHVKAAVNAKVDQNLTESVVHPRAVLESYHRLRAFALKAVVGKIDVGMFKSDIVKDRVLAFRYIEDSGVFVDPGALPNDPTSSESGFVTHLKSFAEEPTIVKTGFDLHNMTKTLRFRPIRGKLNTLCIPRGRCRAAFKSRWQGGAILSIDFNAADYRCIVNGVDDPDLTAAYAGAADFHERTVELMFGEGTCNSVRRSVIKDLTYATIYGGSESKLSDHTGLSPDMLVRVLQKLSFLSERTKALKSGLANLESGTRIVDDPIDGGLVLTGREHPGARLALYAQRMSSIAFMDAVVGLFRVIRNMKSVISFTVHDEVVLDVHPDELEMIDALIDIFERSASTRTGIEMSCGATVGPDYYDQEKYDRHRTD